MAALLHDLAGDKIVENEGLKNIIRYFESQEVKQEIISHILKIIQSISFRGERVRSYTH